MISLEKILHDTTKAAISGIMGFGLLLSPNASAQNCRSNFYYPNLWNRTTQKAMRREGIILFNPEEVRRRALFMKMDWQDMARRRGVHPSEVHSYRGDFRRRVNLAIRKVDYCVSERFWDTQQAITVNRRLKKSNLSFNDVQDYLYQVGMGMNVDTIRYTTNLIKKGISADFTQYVLSNGLPSSEVESFYNQLKKDNIDTQKFVKYGRSIDQSMVLANKNIDPRMVHLFPDIKNTRELIDKIELARVQGITYDDLGKYREQIKLGREAKIAHESGDIKLNASRTRQTVNDYVQKHVFTPQFTDRQIFDLAHVGGNYQKDFLALGFSMTWQGKQWGDKSYLWGQSKEFDFDRNKHKRCIVNFPNSWINSCSPDNFKSKFGSSLYPDTSNKSYLNPRALGKLR